MPAQPKVVTPKKVARWQCQVCGYVHQGEEPPERCPVCGAPRDQFVRIT